MSPARMEEPKSDFLGTEPIKEDTVPAGGDNLRNTSWLLVGAIGFEPMTSTV
jgi:hypothetical protein